MLMIVLKLYSILLLTIILGGLLLPKDYKEGSDLTAIILLPLLFYVIFSTGG